MVNVSLEKSLIKSYFYALSEAEPYPKAIIFINSGIRLTTMNLQVIEYLKKLSDMGTEILSCGNLFRLLWAERYASNWRHIKHVYYSRTYE